MADRFFASQPLTPGAFSLDGPEAHHLSTVRRFQVGDRIVLFNGDGCEYPAEIVEVSKRSVELNILSVDAIDRELPFPIVVGSALPKGDRVDFLLEKLTELGATRFVPLITTRSVVQPKDSKTEKWQRAVIEASKQCGRNKLMAVDPPQSLAEFLKRTDLPERKWILHTAEASESKSISNSTGQAFAIGPEGGFTSEEIVLAKLAGWNALNLGPRILRIETAALAAVVRAST